MAAVTTRSPRPLSGQTEGTARYTLVCKRRNLPNNCVTRTAPDPVLLYAVDDEVALRDGVEQLLQQRRLAHLLRRRLQPL